MSIYAFIGRSGSGKTSYVTKLAEDYPNKFKVILSYTTRPIREGEVDGVDYTFISEKKLEELKSDNKILESRSYKVASGDTWWYATPKVRLSKGFDFLTIQTPNSISSLVKQYGKDKVKVIYLDITREVAFKRLQERGKTADIKEVVRRIKADDTDFLEVNKKFKTSYEIIKTDTDFDKVFKEVLEFLGL